MKRNTILWVIAMVVVYLIGIATGAIIPSSKLDILQQEIELTKSELPIIANCLWLLETELVEKEVIGVEALQVWRESIFEEPNNVSAISNFVNRMLEEVQGIP